MADLPTHSESTQEPGQQHLVRGMSKRTRNTVIVLAVAVVIAVVLLHVTGVISA